MSVAHNYTAVRLLSGSSGSARGLAEVVVSVTPPANCLQFVDDTLSGIFSFDISQSTCLKSVAFGSLVNITGDSGIYLQDSPALESVSFSALTGLGPLGGGGNLWASGCAVLKSFSAPVLATIGNGANLNLYNCPLLATVDLRGLVTIGASVNLILWGNSSLTSLALGAFTVGNNASLDFSGDALDQTTVDFILARCVASAGFLGGAVDLSGGTNAAPSAAGTANKNTLIARGVIVTTN